MGRWSRAEIEEAFAHYQEVAQRAASSGDWRDWANLFTPDASYLEHHFGAMEGREAIYDWIQSTMSEWPGNEMIAFPVDSSRHRNLGRDSRLSRSPRDMPTGHVVRSLVPRRVVHHR